MIPLGSVLYHDRCDNTFLHHSIVKDSFADFKKKLALVTHVDLPDCKGYSPLHIAVIHNKEEHAKCLLEKHADPHFISDFTYIKTEPMSPFVHSIIIHRNSIMKHMFHHGGTFERFDVSGYSPFGLALRYGNDDAVLFFLEKGFDPNVRIEQVYNKDLFIHDLLRKGKHTNLLTILLQQYKDAFSLPIQKKLSSIRLQWLLH